MSWRGRQDLAAAWFGARPFERLDCGARGFGSGVAWAVIVFQETRELVPIEPPPACPQAGEKFEFAACENRHNSARLDACGRAKRARLQVIISFAFRRIACRCKGRHECPSACIPLSPPGTSGTCPPARRNRECTSLHTRCTCGGLRPSSSPPCIYKSVLHRTMCNTCHSFWWRTRL
jgi:hypothetical protein